VDEGRPRRQPRTVCAVADPPEADDSAALRKQMGSLQDALTQATRGMAAMAADTWRGQANPVAAVPRTSAVPDVVTTPSTPTTEQTTATRPSNRGVGRGRGGRRRSRDTDPCRVCGQLGHWASECDQRKVKPIVKGVSCPRVASPSVYVRASFRNRPIRCLLDSDCERSVVGRRYVQGVPLKRTPYTLSAANKTALQIDGDTKLHFTIDGHPMSADVSVSPAVDELLLGSDWLVQNRCRWDFAAGTVHIKDQLIHTYQREQINACRRIFVSEECTVPPRHEANVPVRMMYDNIHCPVSDWAIEPRVIRPGVVAARTLLSDDRVDLVARVCNYSDTPHVFSVDSFLGLAEPVDSDAEDGDVNFAGRRGSAGQGSSTGRSDTTGQVGAAGPGETANATGLRRDMTGPSGGLRVSSITEPQQAHQPDSTARLKKRRRKKGSCQPPAATDQLSDNDDYQHVQCLIERLPDDLTAEQRARAEEFIKSRSHVFSKSEFDIGRTDVLRHRIETGDHAPHFEQLRRHPTTQLPVIDRHVEEMLQHDVIEPAASPWCSNVVMVWKRDGTMRFCVDYHKTNQLIKKDK